MNTKEIERQIDFLNSKPVKEWREKFPEKYEADIARLEALLPKKKAEKPKEEPKEEKKVEEKETKKSK